MYVSLSTGLCPFPSGLPSAQLPFGIQAHEDEWTDDLILVDLGDSCPGFTYTHLRPSDHPPHTHTHTHLSPHSGYPVCDTGNDDKD